MNDPVTGLALESAWGAVPLVPPLERADAERLLNICEQYWTLKSSDTTINSREIGRLVEVLARRSSQAMPFAALARALLADINGDNRQRDSLLREFQIKLSQLGL